MGPSTLSEVPRQFINLSYRRKARRNAMIKQLIAIALLAFASLPGFAATTFSSQDNCEAAWRGNLTEAYQPTAKHKQFGDKRIAGFEKRKLEADACVYMETQAGNRWVFVKAGTEVYTKGTDVKMLAECQNDISKVVYLKREEAPQVAHVTNKVIEDIEVTKRYTYKRIDVCDQTQTRPKLNPETGKLECPEVEVHMPTRIVQDITVQPKLVTAPVVAPQPSTPAAATCTDCRPEMKITKKVARTDGRCVVALRDPRGTIHYARFDTVTNNLGALLVGARVDDVKGEWNKQAYTPTYVGDGKQTVRLQSKDCEVVVQALQNPSIFTWTAPRLGLDANCTVIGPVREM